MNVTVYKNELSRHISTSNLQEYLDAGWQQVILKEITAVLKPVKKASSVISDGESTAINQGE